MSFRIIQCVQREPAWHQARCGRLTGSVAHCVTARGSRGEAVTRRDLRYRLACERITGQPEPDDFLGFDMRRGIEQEPRALAAYEAAIGRKVEKTGFLQHNALMVGCSLDGHVGQAFEQIVELKASKAALHIRHWKLREEFVREHWQQIAHCLWVSGAEACDLCSYNESVPEQLRLLRVTVLRCDAKLEAYIPAAERFLADVESTVREVQALAGTAA